jgi:periplasmic protein CpxP/Spy
MSKIKLLIIAVISLLLINIGMVAFLLLKKPPHPGGDLPLMSKESPRNIIIERLHFDKEQSAQYDILIKDHQNSLHVVMDSIRAEKNKLYSNLNNELANPKDSLMNILGSLQNEIELIHYKHFAALKKICRPQQLEFFNNLTGDLAEFFAREKNKRPAPKD